MKNTLPCSDNFHRRLVAIIAQEVKVPLANALFLLKLNNEKQNGTCTQEFLKSLEKQLTTAHSLFSELLGWSKTYFIPAGSGVLNLRIITEDIIRLTSNFSTTDHIIFINNIQPDFYLPGCYAEAYKFVLRSLILIGTRFSPAGSRCIIEAWPDTAEYKISVSVHNTGIPVERVEKILSSNTVSSEIIETDWALSLLLCRDCLSELGSSLWVDDDGPIFYFTLSPV